MNNDQFNNLQLINVLHTLESLLRECGATERAEWVRERADILELRTSASPQAADARAELHDVVNGMGGLNDLWLDPPVDSKLTRTSLRSVMDGLTEQIWRLTTE